MQLIAWFERYVLQLTAYFSAALRMAGDMLSSVLPSETTLMCTLMRISKKNLSR
jgi:hypothetical protein